MGTASTSTPPPSERSRCPHYPQCAGCSLSGTAYGAQLRLKQARAIDAVAAYPRLAGLEVHEIIGSPRVFGYRNQAKLVAHRTRRGVVFGVYRPGTHDVVDAAACPVYQPPIPAVLTAVRDAVERAAAPIYDPRRGIGWLRYVLVRSSAWKKTAQLILVVRDRSWAGEAALLRRLRRVRGVSSVVLNLNPTTGNVILGRTFIGASHETALLERVGGLCLRSSAGAFLQANIAAVRRVYQQALAWADPQPDDTAVDLYAGVGAISFHLAGRARLVIGVEASRVAVLDAQRNIRLNGYHNVRFVAAAAADGLTQAAAQLEQVDLITLNPPRKGADDACRAAIAACAPSRIVYVSCDPATLARDLDWFGAHGYATVALQPYDLLPQTEHVECVALLRRAGGGAPRRRRAHVGGATTVS
jgi:23S rRNA (uracil1939-C5)-methyltransferase